MSLEGNLRDLALAEVCQLLAHTRKTGELRINAPLAGLSAQILFDSGAIVGAVIGQAAAQSADDPGFSAADAARAVERTVLELLCWTDGEFHFVPRGADLGSMHTGVRLHTEMLLMEGARRSELWERLADRIPNARAIPTFSDIEPRQLPLLQLEPQQWEVLTGVDGQRDLPELAHALGRELLDVADVVHTLIGTGLLKLADVSRVHRTQATPPSTVAESSDASVDLWVPSNAVHTESGDDDDANDEIFDPIRVGVITPEGLPRFRTPLQVSRISDSSALPVGTPSPLENSSELRERGDAAARCGDLATALEYWSAVLALHDEHIANHDGHATDRAHAAEAVALATRLQTLLHAHQPV